MVLVRLALWVSLLMILTISLVEKKVRTLPPVGQGKALIASLILRTITVTVIMILTMKIGEVQ